MDKSSTIPVQFKVTKSSSFAFESVIKGDSGVTPVASGDRENDFSVLHYDTPAGLTVGDITNLTANFNWTYGENHSGGFRWQVEVTAPDGTQKNIMVDYGDASNALQSDTAGSGINMVNSALASQNRDESQQVGGTLYTPWSYVTSNFGSLPVVGIDLVVDGGWGTSNDASLTTQTQDQVINLSTATVGYTGGTSTFSWPAPTSGVVDNSTPAWISLTKTSGTTPACFIHESTLTSTQGDSGGQVPRGGQQVHVQPACQRPAGQVSQLYRGRLVQS